MEVRRVLRKLKHMKKTFFLIAMISIQTLVAQKYITRSGMTSFKASVGSFESIEATTISSSSVLTSGGNIAALILIKGFHFKIALMQEHFNENYMESDEFPKATFKGELIGFSLKTLKNINSFSIEGVLTIKGKHKKIKTLATVIKQNKKLLLKTHFTVSPLDFGIKIPNIVRNKIAQKITISIHYEFNKK